MARLAKVIRWRGAVADRRVRQQFAQFQIEVEIMKLHCFKVMSDLEQGRPQSDVSILKLYGSELVQRLDDFALERAGALRAAVARRAAGCGRRAVAVWLADGACHDHRVGDVGGAAQYHCPTSAGLAAGVSGSGPVGA